VGRVVVERVVHIQTPTQRQTAQQTQVVVVVVQGLPLLVLLVVQE
jgi:hypothetical protein